MKFVAPRWTTLAAGLLGLTVAAAACSASNGSELDEDDSSGGNSSVGGSGEGGISLGTGGAGTGTPTGNNCTTDPAVDDDGDGYSENDGDCNDCDPNSNPGAVEVPTPTTGMGGAAPQPADENCDGQTDEPKPVCDMGLALDDTDAMNAARAIDLCQQAGMNGVGYGVVSAAYVRANGAAAASNAGNGLLSDFGAVVPQSGGAMLGLSSGFARDATDAGNCGMTNLQSCTHNGAGTPPPMFPQDVPGCTGGANINDDVALEVQLHSPTNATGYSFDFAFMSFEFPEWVCTTFNDQFIALVDPPPMGSINGNISFDSLSNPVSVNIALFDNCDPSGIGQFATFCSAGCPSPPNPYCPLGAGFMNGTGFNEWGDSGSTGWLVTTAPVGPDEDVTIRFAIWDTGDSALDSTVLIDNFQWIGNSGEPVDVGTTPIPK